MDYKLPYKVSGNNVYIYGYAVECDLLILKQDSKAIFEAPEIYRAEDVITIIESKATGIFIDKKKPKNPFLNELCMVKQLNDNICSVVVDSKAQFIKFFIRIIFKNRICRK